MRKAILMFFLVMAGLMITSNLSAVLGNWTISPDLRDNFSVDTTAGPNLGYIRDPDLLADQMNPSLIADPHFYSSNPGGWDSGDLGTDYDPDPVAGNPSSDSTVMGIGNAQANMADTLGLCFIDIAAASPGGTDIFLNHEDYRMRVYVYFLGTNDSAWRYQGGIHLRAGSGQPDLFRFGVFHNTSSEGGGPGFGYRRGSWGETYELNYTSPIEDGRWVLMEVEAVGTVGAVGADVNGDGQIDTEDSGEYLSGIDLAIEDVKLNGYPGFWCVAGFGAASGGYSDQSPMLIDDVELWYQPYVAPTPEDMAVEMNWAVYY